MARPRGGGSSPSKAAPDEMSGTANPRGDALRSHLGYLCRAFVYVYSSLQHAPMEERRKATVEVAFAFTRDHFDAHVHIKSAPARATHLTCAPLIHDHVKPRTNECPSILVLKNTGNRFTPGFFPPARGTVAAHAVRSNPARPNGQRE